jgi:D-inositol-3-phosphate glycosyltransferase
VLLFVGRIQPLKGLTVAIEALAHLSERHPDAVLVAVGGPSGTEGDAELAAARALIARHGLADRVRFVPPQPHHLLSTYYRAADVCIVPSRSESFGLVALEAAACGTPVVAAAVGGLLTLVQDGVTGLLVDTRDPADHAAAVAELLDDPARSSAMAAAATELARGYTWSTTAGRLRRLYADLTVRTPVSCS